MQPHRFTGGSEREDSMWSALYAAKSGKLYIGLCTHAEAAHFYEFDPQAQSMRHVADLTDFKGERGKGIRTTGKIHVRMSEDEQGRIYFGDFCEDTGPECVDPASYRGPHWFRYDPAARQLENLGQINRQWGLLGFVLEPKYQRLYGLAEDGHLYTFDLKTRVPLDPRATPRTMSNPLIDRKVYSGPERHWRSVPRALHVAPGGRVYTSGEDGRIVYYDPAAKKLVRTDMQMPGEYYEAWNYYGYPVVEAWTAAPDGSLYGASSDGYLYRLNAERNRLVNLGKPRLSRRVRGMTLGPDNRLYLLCGEFEEPCKLYSYGLDGAEGFCDWGGLTVDRSPYYAKRAYQFDAMAAGIDGTLFLGESDRRACLYLFIPGAAPFPGGFNPKNPR